MIWRTRVLAAILLAWLSTSTFAQELTTDAERDWKAVRNSEDVRTKIMAERWFNAIRQQDWSDASGKFKVSAKYLEHDPDLKWVKLRTIRGTGKGRQVKDVEIPLEKLSKSCQARVRTISVLAEKIAEAKEEEAKKAEEDEDDGGAESGRRGETRDESLDEEATPERTRDGRGARDRGRADVEPREVMDGRDRRRGRGRGDESSAESSSAMANAGPPLPALRPGLPSTAVSSAPMSAPAAATPLSEGMAAVATDGEAWRTNYDAFRRNIKVEHQGSDLYTFDWGPMKALKQAYETNKRWEDFGSVGEEALAEISTALGAVGEVQWEATIQQAPTADSNWNAVLGLPPLPEPFEFTFVLDQKNDPGAWQQLKPGDRVLFTGRFEAFDETYSIVVPIRFPNATGGEAVASEAPAMETTAVAVPLSDTPNLIDNDPWRTDYEAFRTVFEKDEIGVISTRERWPGVLNLQLFVPNEVLQAQERGEPPALVEVPRLAEIGDFQWQGNIVQPPAADANWADVLGLAPLPEPLKLELRLQGDGRDGAWQQLDSREPVRFVGRFIGYRGPYTWVAEIRLLPNEVRH